LRLIEESLSGKMPIADWLGHIYFKTPLTFVSKVNSKNKEIMMINSVPSNNYSLIMLAIDYKKNNQYEKLNQKPLPSPEDQSLSEAIESLQKHGILKYVDIANECIERESRVNANSSNIPETGPIQIDYYYSTSFDPETDYPCRELIKLL
jgi:hypothetical protein